MTASWPDGDGGDDPRAVGVARRAIPVPDGAAEAWRWAARIVAWAGALRGAVLLASILLGTVSGSGGGASLFRDLASIFRGGWRVETLMYLYGLARLALGVSEFVGSVGVLTRRRWGARLLMLYAVATVPTAALYVAWLALRTGQGMGPSPGVMMTLSVGLSSLQGLAYPAVVFFVMRAARPHLDDPAPTSAFEPLPHVPLPGQR
jgi:hypothetical protein